MGEYEGTSDLQTSLENSKASWNDNDILTYYCQEISMDMFMKSPRARAISIAYLAWGQYPWGQILTTSELQLL